MPSLPALLSKSHLYQIQSTIPRKLWPKSHQDGALPLSIVSSVANLSAQYHLPEAFAAFSLLRHRATPSSSYLLQQPISSLLASSAALRSLPAGLQLHALSISLCLIGRWPLLVRLTSFYVAVGLLSDAHDVAAASTTDVRPWNLLISSYVKAALPLEAIRAYKDLILRSVVPDCFTYPSVLSACGEVGDLELGREVHRSILKSGIGWNLFVANATVGMYGKCGAVDVARKVFDKMPDRDVVSWNSIIAGYAGKGMWVEAIEVFERMREESVEVNSLTWHTIAGCHLQMGRHEEALMLISQMVGNGSDVDFVTLVIGLNACSRFGSVRLGKEIHGLAVRSYCDGLETVRNALITMYSRCKSMADARAVFGRAKSQSLVTWNAMIAGFALEDKTEEASLVFQDMIWSGIQPNYVTVVTILSLCARVANLQHGRELHCHIIKHGYRGYCLLWNALIDMYSKSGRISIARKIFDTMIDRDGISYTSMIAGYGMQGEGLLALKLFEEMVDIGIKPDHISMIAILSACSHSGLVSKGQMLFDKMVSLYGLMPQMEHYSCMVDLYARAGLLAEAEEMLNRMRVPPTAAMWAALLCACQVHGNIEIGEQAATKLLEMKTENAGHYVLIANMYAATGHWEQLAKVRKLMRDMGVRKAPGCAWADLGNGFHPFLVGDTSNQLSPEIYMLLDVLYEHMGDLRGTADEELMFDCEAVGL